MSPGGGRSRILRRAVGVSCLFLLPLGDGTFAQTPRKAGKPDTRAATLPTVDALRQQIQQGSRSVQDVLIDTRLGSVRESRAFRDMIRALTTGSDITLVSPGEPGAPLHVSGAIRDTEGKPVAGALVYVYHTDAAGYYSTGGHDSANPRLFGYMKTGPDGRYRFRTVKPGVYADSPRTPMHIHYHVSAPGYRLAHRGHANLYFADDPRLTGATLEELRGDGAGIKPLKRGADGVWRCDYDIVLRKK